MKELLQQYALYNKWANDRIIATMATVPEALMEQHVESSFTSLRLTITHLWEAEYTWFQRLHLAENIVSPGGDRVLSINTILSEWEKQSSAWIDLVIKATDAQLSHVFAYRNSKKEEFKQPVYEVMLHVFNHATYHRGQLVTILNQLKIKHIPPTDFIVWSRGRK